MAACLQPDICSEWQQLILSRRQSCTVKAGDGVNADASDHAKLGYTKPRSAKHESQHHHQRHHIQNSLYALMRFRRDAYPTSKP